MAHLKMLWNTRLVLFPEPLSTARLRLLVSLVVSILFHGLILNTPGHGLILKNIGSDLAAAKGMMIQARLDQRTAEQTPPRPPSEVSEQKTEVLAQNIESQPSAIVSTQATHDKTKRALIANVSESNEERLPSEESAGTQIPVFEQAFTPQYPLLAQIKELRGTVTASFRVGKSGAIEDVEIIASASSGGFDAAVLEALANTRIKPGSVRPNSRMMVTVVFDAAGTNLQGSFSQQH